MAVATTTALLIAGTAAVVGGAAMAHKGEKQRKAAETRAEEFARGQAEEAKAEQARLEEKFGMSPGELEREERMYEVEKARQVELMRRAGLSGEELLAELGPNTRANLDEIARRSGLSGEELLREAGEDTASFLDDIARRGRLTGEELLREAGPITEQFLDRIASRQGKTGEELFRAEGEIPRALQEQVLAEVKEPEKFYQDTLNKELEQVRMQINQEAQRRGVFGGLPEGGIRFEQMGRAGVELAIKSAREKMAQRQQALSNASILAQEFQRLSAEGRSEAAIVAERAIEELRVARGEQAAVGEAALSEAERARTEQLGVTGMAAGEQAGARSELSQFLANLQNLSAGARGRAADVALGAATGVREPALAREADIIAAIEGGRIGSAEATRRAGLELIGQGTGAILGGISPKAAPTGTTGTPIPPAPEYPDMGNIPPTDIERMYQDIRKKRLSNLPGYTGAKPFGIEPLRYPD